MLGIVKRHLFYGASGHTLACSHVLQFSFAPALVGQTVGFIDDGIGDRVETLEGIPVLSLERGLWEFAGIPIVIGVAEPCARMRLTTKVVDAGGQILDFFVERPSSLFPGVEIGPGCAIGSNTYIGARTTIGAHTQIMPNCSIGHDVKIGRYCAISPSCTISGHVVIEDCVLLGAGTTIVNGAAASPLRIGNTARLWAGAVVVSSVPAGAVLAGNPARTLREMVGSIRRRPSFYKGR